MLAAEELDASTAEGDSVSPLRDEGVRETPFLVFASAFFVSM
jgi:hypothetical protein